MTLLSKTVSSCSVCALLFVTSHAFADVGGGAAHDASDNGNILQPIIVTGTRRTGRTATQSATPIDVFTSQDLIRQGTSDTNSLLQALIPSFSVPQSSISTGSSFVRPASLRGLPPDETLVLVNGKRRHRSALVSLDVGAQALLSQAVDLAQIPAVAVERIEVLRDGDSAQYGSDAIAGVINVILRKDDSGFIGEARYGQYYAGDGRDYQLDLDKGLKLGSNGFLNVSAEFVNSGETSRGTQRPGAEQLSEENPQLNIPDPVQRWGQTATKRQLVFFNGGFDFGHSQFYLFGNYGHTEGAENFNWRQPLNSANFAATGLFASTFYLDRLPDGNYDATGRTYRFTQLYPSGFTPMYYGDINDFSATSGYKGETTGGFTYDFYAGYGSDQLAYSMTHSLNPSFGPETQTAFYLGELRQTEINLGADFTHLIAIGLANPLTAAWGVERRQESYGVGLGDLQSWAGGPFGRQVVQNPDGTTFVETNQVGANGSSGFGPLNAGVSTDRSIDEYLDLEGNLTKNWSVGLAGRYSRNSEFGGAFSYQSNTRVALSRWVALRASAGTGFHAPSPGQTSVNSVVTSFLAGRTTPIEVGTFSVTNPAAKYFGAVPVKPEKSHDLSAGVVITPSYDTTVTIDYYRIRIGNRIGLSQAFSVTPADQSALAAMGVQNVEYLNRVQYVTNDFSTMTKGVDLVATNFWRTERLGSFYTSLGADYNATRVTGYNSRVISRDIIANLETSIPRFRVDVAETWSKGPFSLLTRVNYYDAFTVTASNLIAQTFGSKIVTDMEARYQVTDDFSLAFGVQNLFNVYPDKDRRSIDPVTGLPGNGNQYIDASPFGYNGGFWYTRAVVQF